MTLLTSTAKYVTNIKKLSPIVLSPTSVTNKNLKFNLSVNDWIKMNPEGVSYQYEFERFTTDERTQNIRLSSSLNDFRSARIPGKLLLKTLTVAHTYVS